MDLSRIDSSIDVRRLLQTKVCVVGTGGASDLIQNLARSGVGRFDLVDFDTVEASNIARQGHRQDHIGVPKVEAMRTMLKAINPEVQVKSVIRDFTALSDEEVRQLFGDCDLFIFATDRFKAQARGNEVALLLKKPAIWVGLFPRGLGGEAIFWHPGVNACYRCLMANRYRAHGAQKQGNDTPDPLDPKSDGVTIFDICFLDSIAGHLAVGLLTRGAKNRFGRLIDALGDRNFIQAKIDPSDNIGGRDVVREQLAIPIERDAFFAWNTIALRDPTAHFEVCPDCYRFRGDREQGASNRRLVGDGIDRLWPLPQETRREGKRPTDEGASPSP